MSAWRCDCWLKCLHWRRWFRPLGVCKYLWMTSNACSNISTSEWNQEKRKKLQKTLFSNFFEFLLFPLLILVLMNFQVSFTSVNFTDEAKEMIAFIKQVTGGPSANRGRKGARWGQQFTLNYFIDVFMGKLLNHESLLL